MESSVELAQLVVAVVGNKTDLGCASPLLKQQVADFCEEKRSTCSKLLCYEASAKEGRGVNVVFEALAKKLQEHAAMRELEMRKRLSEFIRVDFETTALNSNNGRKRCCFL